MNKKFGLVSAFAIALTFSSASAVFAAGEPGDLWGSQRLVFAATPPASAKGLPTDYNGDSANWSKTGNLNNTNADNPSSLGNAASAAAVAKALNNTNGQVNANTANIDTNSAAIQANNGAILVNSASINDNSIAIKANNDAIKTNSDNIVDVRATADDAKTTAYGAASMTIANQKDIARNLESINAVDTKANANSGRLDENDSMNKIQNAAIDKNTKTSQNNAKRLDENDSMNTLQNKNIDSNTKRLDENDSMNGIQNAAIDKNTKGVAQNKTDIAAAQQAIGDDAFRKVSVQDRLASLNADNMQNIMAASKADRAYTDSVALNTLNKANAYTDSRYNQLDGKINKLRGRVDAGVAGATAIASIPFSAASANSFGGSLGVAKDKVAGAVGYQHNFSSQWSARGTVSVSDNYVQGGIGGSFNW